jgi:abequosyltransferase
LFKVIQEEKMNDIVLSICVPTYNRCFYLIDCLRDLINQAIEINAEKEIEICISNNASTDNTKSEIDKLVSEFPNIRFVINHNKTNIGADRNFQKVLGMQSGKYTILKGDDDYFAPGGLKFLLNEFKTNTNVDFFINDVDVVDLNREMIIHLSYLRGTNELIVNFKNELEARNYLTLCNNIHALGSFISGCAVKTEAFRCGPIDGSFMGTCYSFMYYFWKYLWEGHLLKYSEKSYIQAVVGTESTFGGGVKRDAIDVAGISFIADYFLKDSSLNADFKNVVNRMYGFWPYVPIDQRKDFKERLYPALKASGHPMIRYIKHQSSTLTLLGMVVLSLIPTSWSGRLLGLRRKLKK